ncbi:MAG TPA: hypothetical protein DCQ28_08890 [Bacteroidetes bacterium]|nr:hypothetical protein [Bacteroidota bacterium]
MDPGISLRETIPPVFPTLPIKRFRDAIAFSVSWSNGPPPGSALLRTIADSDFAISCAINCIIVGSIPVTEKVLFGLKSLQVFLNLAKSTVEF